MYPLVSRDLYKHHVVPRCEHVETENAVGSAGMSLLQKGRILGILPGWLLGCTIPCVRVKYPLSSGVVSATEIFNISTTLRDCTTLRRCLIVNNWYELLEILSPYFKGSRRRSPLNALGNLFVHLLRLGT